MTEKELTYLVCCLILIHSKQGAWWYRVLKATVDQRIINELVNKQKGK